MADDRWLAEQFEARRDRLRAVAYRMLGSVAEADDAVQESWLRVSRADTSTVENLGGWLTTVVARVCLDALRARRARREEYSPDRLPDVLVDVDEVDPEHEALLADSVGVALLVVLQTLSPAERLAFVLHDMFGVPFEEIAPVVGRTPGAARKLASRARARVQDAPRPDPDMDRQRKVADAFLAAARQGDFDALLALLDPDVVLRVDAGSRGPGTPRVVRGAPAVATHAMAYVSRARLARPALVNGAAGLVVIAGGQPLTVAALTISHGKIIELDILADPRRLRLSDLGLPVE